MPQIDTELVILLAPLVTAMVEGAKKAGLSDNYAGPAAMIFAFALTALAAEDPTSREAALTAIATGLAASGLYSQIAHYAGQVRPKEGTRRATGD